MNYPNLKKLFFSLNSLLRQLLKNEIELPRISRTACLSIMGGVSPNSVPLAITDKIIAEQNTDGGWVGPDDTMWNVLFLKLVGLGDSQMYHRGLQFLQKNMQQNLGWGRSMRDIPRIPVTGRVLYFLPELNDHDALNRLLNLWDKEKNSLTYKAASVLMACKSGSLPSSNTIVEDALGWLEKQQNDDGGFGPWRNHPAGSDVYCTALALLGIAQYYPYNPVIDKAVSWMADTQLEIGLWGYHQIEDGAAWGWYALNAIQNARTKVKQKTFADV